MQINNFQIGHKLAGVKYLMMSLWSIPDYETKMFMISFYENLNKSNNIRTAFNETQFQMKSMYPNEPYKWAGMVLVE